MTIQQVSFSAILDAPNWEQLKAEYEAECSNPLIGGINPQCEMYAQMESAGLMASFAAFDGADVAGFGTVLTTIYPHYGVKVATAESIFVASTHRNSSIGLDLIAAIENYARESGCIGIYDSAPVGSQFEALLNAKKGYLRTNSVFFRSL
jgi:GNAT superfamily N-acetyltransferase